MKKNIFVVIISFLIVSCGNIFNSSKNTIPGHLEYDESLIIVYLPDDCPTIMPVDTLCGDVGDTIIFVPQERFATSFRCTLKKWSDLELAGEGDTSEELVMWGWVEDSAGYSYRIYPDGLDDVVIDGERYSSVGVDIFVPFKEDTIFAYVHHSK